MHVPVSPHLFLIPPQDTIAARAARQSEPIPGSIPPEESLRRGWFPHEGTFKWPAPRDPGAFNRMDNKPSEFRIEQVHASITV